MIQGHSPDLLKLLLKLLPIIWRDKGQPVTAVPNLGAGIEDVAWAAEGG